MTILIRPYAKHYIWESPNGKIHILNKQALIYHLKKYMGDRNQITDVLCRLDMNNVVTLRFAA